MAPTLHPPLEETTRFLHEQIPLTRAMEVKVESYAGGELTLTAPLEPNHNHLGTAFGGSLSAIATLAGYSLLWLLLDDRSAHIVIRESAIQYHHPVRSVIRAICRTPDAGSVASFKTAFEKAGKARLTLHTVIVEDGRTCVEFSGVFVALR